MSTPTDSRLDVIPTLWSMVQLAHAVGDGSATAARQALVLRYAKALRRYVGAIVKDPEQADELTQDVMMKLMQGNFAGADPNLGRFRDFLKTAVRNMIRNHWAKTARRRTATLAIDAADDAESEAWDHEWQANVLDHAWAALKQHETQHPSPPSWSVLRLRTDEPDATSEELAALLSRQLGTPLRADACRQLLRRARVRFAELLIAEVRVGLTTPSPEAVVDELIALGLWEYVKDFYEDAGK